jgi:hypothetical protein
VTCWLCVVRETGTEGVRCDSLADFFFMMMVGLKTVKALVRAQ